MDLFGTSLPIAARYTAAARRVAAHEDPWVLGYHPVARMNPYQALLYGEGTRSGFAVVAAPTSAELAPLACASAMGVGAIAHLHWTSHVLADAKSEEDADARASTFLGFVRSLQQRGIKTVWTVHNRLPHRCEYPQVERQLRTELASLVDVAHIMTEGTPDAVGDLFTLPSDRLLVAEHPSYLGAYPTHHDPQLVRFETGFEPDDFVVGMIGSIQAYKGVDELLDAFAIAAPDVANLRGLIAGMPGRDPESLELVRRLRTQPMIRAFPSKLDDQNLARLVSSVDVMALPYRSTLNSGAALLALSFGIPVIGPLLGQFVELADLGFCLAYDPHEMEGLAAALRQAPSWAAQVDRDAILDYVAGRTGPTVSERFFAGLRDHLDAT